MIVELVDEHLEIRPENQAEALALRHIFPINEEFCPSCHQYKTLGSKILVESELRGARRNDT